MSSTGQVDAFAESADPPVRGFLHRPAVATGNALVLTHGAGSNAQAPLLRSLADAFAAKGFVVLRCDLPYRQIRTFGPPGPGDAARDRSGLKNAISAIRKLLAETADEEDGPEFKRVAEGSRGNASVESKPERIYLGGHSYGGRQSSMLCAQEPDLVAGLLLLSYPLHPPRRPEQQRTQHLPDLRTPTLFVQGTRDPFGTVEELQRAMKMVPAKTNLLTVEGAGHDLGFKGKANEGNLVAAIVAEFCGLMA